MRAPHLLILLAAGLLMTSCAAPTSTSGASASSVTAGGLAGSRWMLDELGGQPPLEGSVITANFSDDGAVTGTSGCNRYRAGVTINGDAIQVDEAIASTLMACDEALMAQEGAYLAALVAARTFTISGEALTLKDAGGATSTTFVAESQELAGTSWQVSAYNNGKEAVVGLLTGTTASVVFGDDYTISGSAGCNRLVGEYAVSTEGVIDIGPLGSTRMMCVEPEGIMEQEAAIMAALESAATYSVDGNRLEMRTAADQIAVQFTRG